MVKQAIHNDDYQKAAMLFHEYAVWLNIDLSFQHFEEELNSMKKMYAPPFGNIFLYLIDDEFVACVAIRKTNETTAELKRMYVKETYRGKGIGQALMDAAIAFATSVGYDKIQLDTLNNMIPAMNLYKKNGFTQIPAYYHNPYETAVYFEKKLNAD